MKVNEMWLDTETIDHANICNSSNLEIEPNFVQSMDICGGKFRGLAGKMHDMLVVEALRRIYVIGLEAKARISSKQESMN